MSKSIVETCVGVMSPSFSRSTELITELEGLGIRVVANTEGRKFSEAETGEFLRQTGATIALIGLEPMSRVVMETCPALEAVCKFGVGTDNVDKAALEERGIYRGWTGGLNRRSVTELALAFALGHSRNIFCSIDKMRKGEWDKRGGRQLSDMTVGIVGLGHIGGDFARVLRALGCDIQFTDIVDKSAVADELELRDVSYRELVATSDILSFHVPSTPLTRGMVGASEIREAAKVPFVINTCRGDVVEFDATIQGVKAGDLSGFGTDVFPEEPFDGSHLADLDHVYMTPHIGGTAREAVLSMGRSAIKHVRHFLEQNTGG